MELTWLCVAMMAVGQAVCVAGVVEFMRAQPKSRFPFWGKPQNQSARSKVLVLVGTVLTVAGALLLNAALGLDWRRALVVIGGFVPMFLAVLVVNARASSARRSTSPN